MQSSSCSFRYVKFFLFCTFLFILDVSSFGQTKREYIFKNGKLVGVSESCSFTLSAASASAPMEGSTGTVTVSSNAVCSWTAESNASWIHISSGATGSGTGPVSYSVDANPGDVRSGTITIEDQTFTISQAAHCQVLCPSQAQYCGSQISVEGCLAGCSQSILQQYPECQQYPGPCMEFLETCGTQCQQAAQQSCTNQYNFCMAECNDACNFSLSATSASVPPAATSGTVTISSVACNWTASSNAAWIHITSATSGTGTTPVSYLVDANPGQARTGTLTIQGRTLTVTQANGCTYTASPASASVGAAAGSGSVNVTCSHSGCGWTASSDASWLHPPANGTGSQTVTYTYDANPGPARTGTLTIQGRTLTVTQANGCTYTISSATANPGSGAGTGSVTITPSNGSCPWTASSNATGWLTVGSASGAGTQTISYSYTANNGPQRTGVITLGGKTHTVTQANGCTYTISSATANPGSGAGTGSVTITPSNGSCPWTASSNATGWLTVGSASGTGSATLNYSYTANTGPQRSGVITLGGKTHTVTQANGCTYTISPTSASKAAESASTGSVSVTASNTACTWTASSNATSWLTVSSGASGTGNGAVGYSVAANTGNARNGTITIAGQTFTASQPAHCQLQCPVQVQACQSGAASCQSACGQSVTQQYPQCLYFPDDIQCQQLMQACDAQCGQQVNACMAYAQECLTSCNTNCAFGLSAASASVAAGGGSGSFTVSSSNCPWTAAKSASWITISSGGSGVGNGP